MWWTAGVKTNIRKNCAGKQEDEGNDNKIPKEAYLTLLDLKTTIEANWSLLSSVMEEVSGLQGKTNATKWILRVNEKRKLWAHPLKQRFINIDPSATSDVRSIQAKLRAAIQND